MQLLAKPLRFLPLAWTGILLCLDAGITRAAEVITQIADVRGLTREEAAETRPVLFSGVVTWRGADGQFMVQDESAATWVGVSRARRNKLWAGDESAVAAIGPGRRVEVEGVADPGGSAPVILPRTVRVLGEQELPAAERVGLPRFFSGAADCLRVEVGGIVQAFQAVESGWLLHLRTNLGPFTAEFPTGALRAPDELVDAEARVTGVAVARFSTRGNVASSDRIQAGPLEGFRLGGSLRYRGDEHARSLPVSRAAGFPADEQL